MLDTTKNRAMIELIFDKMIAMGFVPYDIQYGNGYFIFNFGDESVVHFRVKGLSKHWKFGIWVYSNYLDEVRGQPKEERDHKKIAAQLFTQWDTQIDKFKPSASDIAVDFTAASWAAAEESGKYGWLFNEMGWMLRSMKRHPFIAYAGFPKHFDRSYILHFVRNEWEEGMFGVKDWLSRLIFVPYMTAKCAIARRAKGFADIEIYDFEKNNPGLLTTYAYQIRVTFPQHTTSEQDYACLNRWFKRDTYGTYRNHFDLYELSHVYGKIGADGERNLYREE